HLCSGTNEYFQYKAAINSNSLTQKTIHAPDYFTSSLYHTNGINIDGTSLQGILGGFSLGNAAATRTNALTLGSSTLSGGITGGIGSDNIILNGTTVNGTISLGVGNDTLNATDATLSALSISGGDNNITLAGSSVSGTVILGAGNDNVILDTSRSTITFGSINLGGASNTLNATNTLTLQGGNNIMNSPSVTQASIIGGANTDTIVANNFTGTLDADINLNAGNDLASFGATTISGNIDLGDGNDTLNLTSTTINGNIIGGAGDDVININSGSQTVFGGSVQTINNLNINNNASLSIALSGQTTTSNINIGNTRVNNGAVLSISNDVNLGTGNIDFQSGSTLSVNINNSGTTPVASKIFTLGNISFSGNITINPRVSSGMLGSDQTHVIATALGSGITNNNAVFSLNDFGLTSFDASISGNHLLLTTSRLSSRSIVSDAQTIAVIDAVSFNPNIDGTIVTALDTAALQGAGALSDAAEQIAPSSSAIPLTTTNIVTATQAAVGVRQSLLRTIGGGLATGNGQLLKGSFWLRPFYYDVDQERRGRKFGFKADGGGLIGGIDFNITPDTILGVGGSYSATVTNQRDASKGETDTQSYNAYLYASHSLSRNIVVDGQIGSGVNEYQTTSRITFGGLNLTRKGDFDGMQHGGHLRVLHRNVAGSRTDNFIISPSLGT
ncbi:MAG: autotransporter domain-containing protein, partial [Pseudomonadota bacterium]